MIATTSSTGCFHYMTTSGAASDDKARITTAIVFQYTYHSKMDTTFILSIVVLLKIHGLCKTQDFVTTV